MAATDDPGNPPDPSGNPPPSPTGDPAAIYAQVAGLYNTVLGRPARSADEINAWIRDHGNDIATIERLMRASPEGVAYAKKQAGDPGPGPGPNPAPAPAPGGAADLSYEEALAHANATAGTSWGRALTAADIEKMKGALGFTPGARIPKTSLTAIDAWITANKPPGGPTTAPPGGPTFTTPPPGAPPGSYGGPFPTFTPPPAYVPGTFAGPTAADLLQDPSYQFRFDQGIKGIQADKAATGVLNSAPTAKALLGYGQDFASQEFKNVWDRKLSTFNTNEDNRMKGYATNLMSQFSMPYDYAYQAAKDQQGSAQRAGEFNYNGAYNTWVQQFQNWHTMNKDWWDRNWQVANG